MDRKEYLKARIMEGMGKKSGTKPMSDKEKSLAALAHPKDKITHKDVLVGRGVLKKEEVELDEMDKSQPSSSRGAEGLPLGKKAEPIKTDKAKQDALKALQKQYKKVKEEVEQIDELKKGTLMSYVGKAREKNIKDSAKNRLAGTETSLSDIDKQQAKVSKRSKGIQRAYTRLNKEEVEQIGEAIRVTTLNSRSYGHPEDTPKGSPQRKRLASQFKKIKNDTKNKSTFGVQARKYMKPGDSVHYGDVGIAKEEVEQVDEGNKENKAKKNTYVANIIKKKLSSQVLPSLKFGRRELKKEEVEQVDIVESLEKPKTIKVTTKNGWKFDGLIKVTGSDYHIVKHPVTGKQYRVDKSGNSIEENVEAATEYMTSDIQEQRVRILEKINMKKAEMGDVIKDFYKSKAPQFKGRSKEKRRQMAIAAKLSAMRKRGSME